MADEVKHDPPSPGTGAVEQFSNEVRDAFADVASLAVKRETRGYLVTGLIAAVVAGSVSWLVASPRPATTSFVMQNVDGTSLTCSRTADSGPPHSTFICRLQPR